MSVRYLLKVHRDLRLVNYSPRLRVMRNLVSCIAKNRLSHTNMNEAVKAAKVISKSPIVTYVTLTRVEESEIVIFRNGEYHTT